MLHVGAQLLLFAGASYLMHTEPLRPGTRWWLWAGVATGCAVAAGVAWRLGASTADVLGQQRVAESEFMAERITHLHSVLADGLKDVQETVDKLRRGERPRISERPSPPDSGDPLDALEYELRGFVHAVQTSVVEASSHQQMTAHLTIGRRMQSLLNGMLKKFDDLERNNEDPGILRPVFHLDHMATRARRLAESITLVGGAVARRSTEPTPLSEVIGHAISEVEHYQRIKVGSLPDGIIQGHVAVGLVHMLAELLDNATYYSPPESSVVIGVETAHAGVIIEIDDRGKLIPWEVRDSLNRRLSDPARHNEGEFVHEGRIGLWVVAEYARRLGLQVQLRGNVHQSNQAVVFVPLGLFQHDHTAQEQPRVPSPSWPHPEPGPVSGSRSGMVTTAQPAVQARNGGRAGGTPPGQESASARDTDGPAVVGGLPPLLARRRNEEPRLAPAVAPSPLPGSMAASGAEAPPLPSRDRNRSYMAAQLQAGALGPAAPAVPPTADLMTRFAAGRLRADAQGGAPDSRPRELTDSHTLEDPHGEHH